MFSPAFPIVRIPLSNNPRTNSEGYAASRSWYRNLARSYALTGTSTRLPSDVYARVLDDSRVRVERVGTQAARNPQKVKEVSTCRHVLPLSSTHDFHRHSIVWPCCESTWSSRTLSPFSASPSILPSSYIKRRKYMTKQSRSRHYTQINLGGSPNYCSSAKTLASSRQHLGRNRVDRKC